MLGFLFSFIALFTLIAVPKLEISNAEKQNNKPKPEWYYKPVKRISGKEKAVRLLIIFLGIIVLVFLAKILGK